MRLSKPIAAFVAVLALLLSMFAAPLAAQSTAQDGSDFEVLRVDLSGDTGLVAFRPQQDVDCLLYTSPSPRDQRGSRMPSSA